MRAGKAKTPLHANMRTARRPRSWPKLEELLGQQGKAVVRRVREWLGMIPATSAAPTIHPKKVKELPPYRVFPVDALPSPLKEYVSQGALALGCDPSYLALPALAVIASCIGNTRTIRLKRNWFEPSIIWSVIVGDSGTLKSPAYILSVSYLFKMQKRLLMEFQQKLAAHEKDLAEYKEKKKKAKDGGSDPGDPPERPVLGAASLFQTAPLKK